MSDELTKDTRSSAPDGSAFTLVKSCPDGRTVTVRLESEEKLKEHLLAMWQYTEGYGIVSIFREASVSYKVAQHEETGRMLDWPKDKPLPKGYFFLPNANR